MNEAKRFCNFKPRVFVQASWHRRIQKDPIMLELVSYDKFNSFTSELIVGNICACAQIMSLDPTRNPSFFFFLFFFRERILFGASHSFDASTIIDRFHQFLSCQVSSIFFPSLQTKNKPRRSDSLSRIFRRAALSARTCGPSCFRGRVCRLTLLS